MLSLRASGQGLGQALSCLLSEVRFLQCLKPSGRVPSTSLPATFGPREVSRCSEAVGAGAGSCKKGRQQERLQERGVNLRVIKYQLGRPTGSRRKGCLLGCAPRRALPAHRQLGSASRAALTLGILAPILGFTQNPRFLETAAHTPRLEISDFGATFLPILRLKIQGQDGVVFSFIPKNSARWIHLGIHQTTPHSRSIREGRARLGQRRGEL